MTKKNADAVDSILLAWAVLLLGTHSSNVDVNIRVVAPDSLSVSRGRDD